MWLQRRRVKSSQLLVCILYRTWNYNLALLWFVQILDCFRCLFINYDKLWYILTTVVVYSRLFVALSSVQAWASIWSQCSRVASATEESGWSCGAAGNVPSNSTFLGGIWEAVCDWRFFSFLRSDVLQCNSDVHICIWYIYMQTW